MENNEQYNKDLEYLRNLLDEDELKEVLDLEKNLNESGKGMCQIMNDFVTIMGGDDNNEENN